MSWTRLEGVIYKLSALVISGSYWYWSSINDGVHQGYILGVVLFLVYITDSNANIRLVADDTSLYIVVDYPDTACTVLNSDLHTVYSRHGLYPSTQSSSSPCYFRENLHIPNFICIILQSNTSNLINILVLPSPAMQIGQNTSL